MDCRVSPSGAILHVYGFIKIASTNGEDILWYAHNCIHEHFRGVISDYI